MASGIYIILNSVNGKCYVGQAVDIKRRWRGHLCDLKKGKHHCKHLQFAWNKYGAASFEWLVLDEVNPDQLTEQEQFWMDYLRFTGAYLYNTSLASGSPLGCKRSPETKAKIQAARAGWKPSAEHRARISAAHLGKKVSPEVRARASARMKGIKPSSKAIENSVAARRGVKQSAEHVEKRASLHRGVKQSADHVAKRAAVHKGKKLSAETIAKRQATRARNKAPKAKLDELVG